MGRWRSAICNLLKAKGQVINLKFDLILFSTVFMTQGRSSNQSHYNMDCHPLMGEALNPIYSINTPKNFASLDNPNN